MSDPINQVHGVPRLPDGTPLAPRRSHFLDTTQKCFYGPGQDPNSGDQTLYNTVGEFETSGSYTAPGDWPAAGTLLRVPQVVWIAKRMADIDTRAAIEGGADPDFFGALSHEDYRLDLILDETTTRLADLRPGRTFVSYFYDWFFNPVSVMVDTMDHMLAPPVTEASYFGTNFLWIWAGLPIGKPSLARLVGVEEGQSTGITPWLAYTGSGEWFGEGSGAALPGSGGSSVPGVPPLDDYTGLGDPTDSILFALSLRGSSKPARSTHAMPPGSMPPGWGARGSTLPITPDPTPTP